VKLWVDAQLPPGICAWIEAEFNVEATAVRDLGLRDATDSEIFAAAREVGSVIVSKDSDFARFVTRLGAPPQVLWVTCGNTTNTALRAFLAATLPGGLELLRGGEPLVRLLEVTPPSSGKPQ